MELRTKVFELANGKYENLSELARAMEVSASHVYRVRQGKRSINKKFIIGTMKAFPGCKFDELFYFTVRLKPNGDTRKDEDGKVASSILGRGKRIRR